MQRFDLIVCLKTESNERHGFIKRLVCYIKEIFKRPDVSTWVNVVDFDNEMSIGVIKIPYDINKIKNFSKKRRERLVNSIHESCKVRNIECCIIPEALLELEFNESVFKKFFTGRFIFKSALVEILNKISIINKRRMDDLDVVIINGNDNSELLRVISAIALKLKYLTIAFKDDNGLENEIDRIFEDTGTAISSTRDIKSATRNADVIINLDDYFELPKQRLKPETVILNYSNKQMNTEICHRMVINNMKLKLPKHLRSSLGNDILDFFSEIQIGEIIIGHMINCIDKIENSLFSEFLDKEFSRIIKKDGYEILIP